MRLFLRQNWPWRCSTLLVDHSSQWSAMRKATFSGWILSQNIIEYYNRSRWLSLQVLNLCNSCASTNVILMSSSCSTMTNRSGPAKKQFYIARLLAATHVQPCIGWGWVSVSFYLLQHHYQSPYISIQPPPRHLCSTTPLSIWQKDGERIDTTYETPSQYKAVNEHRSVYNA